jgi:predicted house-cleaning NTP pyrophosphatase (Maf/HAM1 superfamily)
MVSMGEPLILASVSPTRKRLLTAAGLAFLAERHPDDEAAPKTVIQAAIGAI